MSSRQFTLDGGVTVEVEEQHLPPVVALLMSNGIFEKDSRELIKKYVPQYPHLPVIEIGAGSGVTTVELARITDEKVVAVDANEDLREVQDRTAELNDVEFEKMTAAYDPRRNLTTTIRIDGRFHGWTGSSVIDDHIVENAEERRVRAMSLGDIRYRRNINGDFILVMDAEGAERLLVHDREHLKDAQLLILEVHPVTGEDPEVDMSWFDENLADLFVEEEYIENRYFDHAVYRRKD